MEWWEILGIWNTVVENLNRQSEENEKYRSQINRNSGNNNNKGYLKGNISTKKLDTWVKKPDGQLSPYVKDMRMKILRGQIK